jgi:peptide/nickel transport system substrate-binding protein
MLFPRLAPGGWRAFCVIAALCAVSVVACRRSSPPAAEARTLRIGTQKTVEAPRVLTDLLYADPLLTIDWHGRPSLRLASSYQWQDEGRTLQLSIRPGVQFHDGSPVTAANVAEVLRQKARTGGFQFVTTVDALPEGVVVIHLSRPDAFLLDTLSGTPIVPVGKPDIGTGPFRLLNREPVIRAERNVNYYRGVPGIEQVQVTTYDTARAAWAAMMRGEVDMVTQVNRESVEFLERAARFDTYSSIRPFYIPLVFNVRHPILRNVDVRRALAEAIDMVEIVRQAMRGNGQVAEDPLWPFNWAYSPAARRHSFDPGGAAARLDAAGFPVRRPAQPGTMPSRFRIRCLFWTKDVLFERIALMLQRHFATVGVDLVLEPVDQNRVEDRIRSGDFDTYIYQHASGKSFEYTYRFWYSDSNGAGAIQNAGYTGVNAALERLRASHSDAEVRISVADLRQRFYEDVPAAFIAWPEATRAVDSRFDVGDASDPEILANLWRWTAAKPEQRTQR